MGLVELLRSLFARGYASPQRRPDLLDPALLEEERRQPWQEHTPLLDAATMHDHQAPDHGDLLSLPDGAPADDGGWTPD
jgi:hypothetical protein